jgi:purine-cytosine permease-like protein
VTNEQYLQVSYFLAATAGVVAAVVTGLLLARAHREATEAPALARLGKLLRRVFPTWLILAVLLGFLSVSYFDCDHHSYSAVVANREYLVNKTEEQASSMARYLATALIAYGFVLAGFLLARARADAKKP